MAAVPAEVIHQAVETATAEGKVVTKANMKRAETPVAAPPRSTARTREPSGWPGIGFEG
jgi:hypothetical protein